MAKFVGNTVEMTDMESCQSHKNYELLSYSCWENLRCDCFKISFKRKY